MEPFIYKTPEQVQQLLTSFKEWTKQPGNGQYRIPYSLWRDLSKAQKITVLYPTTGEFYYKLNDDSTHFIEAQNEAGEGLRQYFANLVNCATTITQATTAISSMATTADAVTASSSIDVLYPAPFETKCLNEKITKNNTKYDLRKENNKMNNFIPNLTFGPLDNGSVAFSPYGIAVRCGSNWLTYDPVTAQTVDVTGFTFDLGKMIYKIPIAVKDVKPGDLIDHQRKLVYVTEVQDTKIVAVDLIASEEKTIIPLTNMFHFNFVTKIATLVNFNIGAPSADQPFGNIMPIIMWSTLFNNDDEENGMDFGKLMMLSAMTGGQNPFSFMAPASNG